MEIDYPLGIPKMRTTITLVLSCLLLGVACSMPQAASDFPKLTGPYLGQKPPGTTPEIFAPGVVSTDATEHGAPVFSPDGNEVYWFSFPGPATKMMHRESGQWTPPEKVGLGGNPTMSPDGKMILFYRRENGRDGIGFCERTDSGWSEKKWFDSLINKANTGWEIWLTKSGTVYFSSSMPGGSGGDDICRARLIDGKYRAIENLGSSANSPSEDWGHNGGFVAPDETYLIFSSDRPGGFGGNDLYVSFRKKDGTWSEAANLGKQINTDALEVWPYVSPDGKYLFYISHRNNTSDIFWVFAKIIDELRPK
jgi:Tol biopolymer transport system component